MQPTVQGTRSAAVQNEEQQRAREAFKVAMDKAGRCKCAACMAVFGPHLERL